MKYTTMALIPVRAADGGVTPFTDLCGEPLLAYTLRVAEGCAEIDSVAVVADEPSLAEKAERLGARVVTSEEASAVETETLVQLGAMSPMVTAGTLRRALAKFRRTSPRPVLSAVSVSEEHPFRLKHMDDSGQCQSVIFGTLRYDLGIGQVVHGRTGKPVCFRQNLPPVYAIGSAVVVCRGRDAARLPEIVATGVAVPMKGSEMMVVTGPLSLLRAEMALEAAGSL